MVDQKAGRIRRDRGEMPSLFGQLDQPLDHLRIAALAAHHFHQLHQRHRVEEMKTGHPLRAAAGRGDPRDRQRRGIGRQHRVLGDQRLQLDEQRLLGLEVLDDGLDQQVATGQLLQGRSRLHARQGGIEFFGAQAALGQTALQQLAIETQRLGDRLAARVVEPHLFASAGKQLSDAPPHGAGTDDSDTFEHPKPLLTRCTFRNAE